MCCSSSLSSLVFHYQWFLVICPWVSKMVLETFPAHISGVHGLLLKQKLCNSTDLCNLLSVWVSDSLLKTSTLNRRWSLRTPHHHQSQHSGPSPSRYHIPQRCPAMTGETSCRSFTWWKTTARGKYIIVLWQTFHESQYSFIYWIVISRQ